MKDKELILKGLNISNNQTIIDLGAGDGVVIFEAAYEALKKHTNTRFIALDINPILIGIMWIKLRFHPNRKNVKIIWGDMFKVNYKGVLIDSVRNAFPTSARALRAVGNPGISATYQHMYTFYLYISPWLIEKVVSRVKEQIPHARFVSYFYPIKSMKKTERAFRGVHNLYTY